MPLCLPREPKYAAATERSGMPRWTVRNVDHATIAAVQAVAEGSGTSLGDVLNRAIRLGVAAARDELANSHLQSLREIEALMAENKRLIFEVIEPLSRRSRRGAGVE